MHERRFDPKQAHKLEDPERPNWLPPDEVLAALALKPGQTVADIGAGTGYFAIPMSRVVGDGGKVLAVDCAAEMLRLLRQKLADSGAPRNIELIEGDAAKSNLPAASCDLVLFANVWHEVDDHTEALRECERILRPQGRVAILDWSPDATRPPGPPLEHRIGRATVESMFAESDWSVQSAREIGPYTYLIIAQAPQPLA